MSECHRYPVDATKANVRFLHKQKMLEKKRIRQSVISQIAYERLPDNSYLATDVKTGKAERLLKVRPK